jgi:hypothetical protein
VYQERTSECESAPGPARRFVSEGVRHIRTDGGRPLGAAAGDARGRGVAGRGLHSSTLQLNVCALCVTGGAVRGRSRGVLGVVRGTRGVKSVLLCLKRLKFG